MGFDISLLIALSHAHEVKEYKESELFDDPPEAYTGRAKNFTVWRAETALNLGRVTRMEKVTSPRYQHLNHSSKELAGICMASVLLRNLAVALRNEGYRALFAPPFLTEEERHKVFTFEGATDGVVYVDVAGYERYKEGYPYREGALRTEFFHKHNEMVKFDEVKLARYVKKEYSIVVDPPLVWESCETVTRWFDEMETTDTEEWRELLKDSAALAFTQAHRGYIREMARVGARVVFTFPW